MLKKNPNNYLEISGFNKAKIITRKFAQTFYFASIFLDEEKRNAAYAVYAVCRISDETVDSGNLAAHESLENLKKTIGAAFSDVPLDNELLLAFRKTVNNYQIPIKYFNELLQGMYMDLEKTRYQTFSQLYDYCYKVAGVVGLIMLKIFGYENPDAEEYAINLGIAMQLTNILRDIKEDFLRGRIYLPQDEMNEYHITQEHIAQEIIDHNFIDFMRFQIKRAKRFYLDSQNGIKIIPDRNSRFVACAMKDMYEAILYSIERNEFDVYSQRANVNLFAKLGITLRLLAKGQYR